MKRVLDSGITTKQADLALQPACVPHHDCVAEVGGGEDWQLGAGRGTGAGGRAQVAGDNRHCKNIY